MTPCAQLRQDAAGIAALGADDPDRVAFLAHAKDCPGCLRALHDAEEVLRLLDAAPRPAPAASALRRASAQIVSELRWLSRQPAVRAGAVAAGWLCLLLVERHRAPDGWLVSALVAGAAALIAAYLRGLLAPAGALLLSAALALYAGREPGLAPVTGVVCMLMELVVAVFPLAAVFWLVRKTGSRAPEAVVPAAVAGALAGQAGLHLTCPAHSFWGHVWAFHFTGVAVAALAAGLWTKRAAGRAARAPPPPTARD